MPFYVYGIGTFFAEIPGAWTGQKTSNPPALPSPYVYIYISMRTGARLYMSVLVYISARGPLNPPTHEPHSGTVLSTYLGASCRSLLEVMDGGPRRDKRRTRQVWMGYVCIYIYRKGVSCEWGVDGMAAGCGDGPQRSREPKPP